ncbi:MAG: Sec-independent protein translocase protein TatB [Betaproteobacteria bacterium]|jgi:sec-independent protein translocase protein TatB
MFDIGFSEMLVVAVVALIVIGPERLPKVARTLGHLFGRMQRYVNDVKSDISREMELEELRKLQATVEDAARAIETSVTHEISATETELTKVAADVSAAVELPAAEVSPVSEPLALETPADEPAAQPVAVAALAPSEAAPQLELGLEQASAASPAPRQS